MYFCKKIGEIAEQGLHLVCESCFYLQKMVFLSKVLRQQFDV